MTITFRVDDVAPVRDRLPTQAIETAVGAALDVELRQVSHRADVLAEGRGFHPLLEAIHVAFAQHRPLTLSPDHVWLTLAQGFATHVERNAEALRERFVRHEGKNVLVVEVLELPDTTEAWRPVVAAFGEKIAEHVGPGVHRMLACAFTTTTEVERTASGIVTMSAFKRYFDYEMRCVCGIPEITLEGTPADWADIRQRLDVLAEYDLEWWALALRPVLDQLVRTSEGKPDRDFWQCIYKPEEVYGGEISTGWIMRLFPYLEHHGRSPATQPSTSLFSRVFSRGRWITPGVSPTSVPLSWSNARIRVAKVDGSKTMLTLFGGFAGVRQLDDGALRPEVAWAVGETPRMAKVVERIAAEHTTTPKQEEPKDDEDIRRFLELPGELAELYDSMNDALLFGRWRILARRELFVLVGDPERGFVGLDPCTPTTESYSPSSSLPVVPFCLLDGDPRFFALYGRTVVLCDPRVVQDVEEIPVVALSTAEFLERIMEHEGRPWFDEPGYQAPALYVHLDRYHDHLRRAIRMPRSGEPVPTDLTPREMYRMVMAICANRLPSGVTRQAWWDALRVATGTKLELAQVFREERGRYPIHVLQDLGLN